MVLMINVCKSWCPATKTQTAGYSSEISIDILIQLPTKFAYTPAIRGNSQQLFICLLLVINGYQQSITYIGCVNS